MWSCATFYHLLNRFPQPNDNCISTPENGFYIKVYKRYTWFHFELNFHTKFLDFREKMLFQKEQDSRKLFQRTKKILNIFKNVPEKRKNFKAI